MASIATGINMNRDWEELFRGWAKPPGKTEQNRCENAVSAIRNAIKASHKLKSRDISIFTQGSYRNNTNVRRDSDVDVGVLCSDVFYHDPLPEGLTEQALGFSSASYHYDQFKNEIEEALISHFGWQAVKRGNKAFDVHETSYHVEADVAAFFDHRRYKRDGSYDKGVALLTDNEKRRVINWPEQHYANGVWKNSETGTRYKSMVRILKSLSNEMTDAGIAPANIPGFLIECLVWNVPNDHFQKVTYHAEVRSILAFLFNNTQPHDDCKKWVEVSGLKWLFGNEQKWTWQQAHAFTAVAWDYIGYD